MLQESARASVVEVLHNLAAIRDTGLGQMRWPKGSFARKFTKDELLRVPKDDEDRPIAQKKKDLKLEV